MMLENKATYELANITLPDKKNHHEISVSMQFARYSLKEDKLLLLPYTTEIEVSTYNHIVYFLRHNIKNTIVREDVIVYCLSSSQAKDIYDCYTFVFESVKDAKYVYKAHKAKLLKIISHFQNNIEKFINSACVPQKTISLNHYNIAEIQKAKKNYAKDMLETLPDDEPSDREFEVLILYANGGYTSSEIAEKLEVTTRTIEAHLENIRDKTGCRNRSAMKKYLIERGWDSLERFYLSEHLCL